MATRDGADQQRTDWVAMLGLGAIAVTRILLRSHMLYDLDSVNFALGMARFDPTVHQPHPPGYFLYVCLARLVNSGIGDPNSALVAISIGASIGAAWLIYLLTCDWYGSGAARMSLLLFLVSPLCWFHGIVALTYMVEAFFSALIGFLAWRAWMGRGNYAIGASIAFAVAAGFRPSCALLLGPLWLLSIWRVRGARRIAAISAAALLFLAWFVPMVEASGGAGAYFGALQQLWQTIVGRRTTLSSPWLVVARVFTIGWIFILCFGFAAAFLFRTGAEEEAVNVKQRNRIIAAWIAPGLFFFTFVFLSFINSGYLLVVSPPLFAVLAARVHRFADTAGQHRSLRHAAMWAGALANCILFAAAPLYCSYRSIREFEVNMSGVARDFRTAFDPDRTLIVAFDSHFMGFRHAGYYLPGFVTAEYPEVTLADGKRVFMMRGRDTEAVLELPVSHYDRFVLFPLPEGEQYTDYLASVLAKLPAGIIQTKWIAGRRVLTGPASALSALFQATARRR